ncbi:hypothetical protein H2199_008926 [Coniosporium tulheliwenetii]|uniref:Uncharacterized protein n=1 Tax=Coniosporium tulheliwenetii TaxID=3383036 RepID=A0ACC2YGX7_9PEZI|nr:hypothetical protein H2199_008926 [Cladosporium sp. JES 115]
MLSIDSTEASNRMGVELKLVQREVDVLQQAEERRRGSIVASAHRGFKQAVSQANAETLNELSRHCQSLQNDNEELRAVLEQFQKVPPRLLACGSIYAAVLRSAFTKEVSDSSGCALLDDLPVNGSLQSRKVAYVYDSDAGSYAYVAGHPMKPHRIRMAHSLVMNYGLCTKMKICVVNSSVFVMSVMLGSWNPNDDSRFNGKTVAPVMINFQKAQFFIRSHYPLRVRLI